jgi:hypothetical protein
MKFAQRAKPIRIMGDPDISVLIRGDLLETNVRKEC